MKSILLMLVFLFLSSSFLLAQDGALDLTFNSTGKVTTSIGSGYDFGKSVAIQSDGKIVVAGNSNTGTNYYFALSRYNSNGTIDAGFGNNGKVTTSFGSASASANSVAIQSDGKIVAAGYASGGNGNDFVVVRYNIDGSLDNTFGADLNGIVKTVIVVNDDDQAYGIAIQPADQKIVVAGFARLVGGLGGNYDFAIVRYNTNGSLDTGFGSNLNGIVTTDFGSPAEIAYSVAIQSNGKIVVAGYSGINQDFAIARYNSNGTLDNTFDIDGKVTTAIGSAADVAYSVAIQSDGKIVAAGSAYIGNANDFAVVRYNSDGSLDNTFDNDGKVTTAIGTGADLGNSVALQSDGKIVVAGSASIGYNNIAIVRYNSDGSLDNTFDTDGKVTTAVGSSGSDGASIAIQSDGKIVVAGDSYIGANDADFAVVRYSNSLQFTVTTTSNPVNGGTTTGGGTYNSGNSVNVTATTNSGYSFTNWTENGTIVSTNSVYTFTISGNRTLVANFTAINVQNEACFSWDLLSSTAGSSTSGNIVGQPETIGGGSSAPLMSIFSPYIANGQKLGVLGGWLPGSIDLQRFIEFKVAPTSGNSLNVTSVSFNYGDNPQINNFNVINSQVFYSIDGTNWTQLGGTLSYLNTTMTTFTMNISGGVQLTSSQTFSLRIYPYSLSGSVATTVSFAVHNHVLICGTTSKEQSAATVTPGGPDQVCQSASPSPIMLSGASIGGSATMGAWSITSGGGTLSSTAQTATPASVTYTPSANYSGTVILKLTTNSTPPISATRTININAQLAAPASITGTFTLCVGSTTQLTDVTGGGIWTSGSTGVATVNASTGLVTGVTAGTAIITYTIGGVAVLCSNSVTQTVTVNASPTISGTSPASRCGTGTVTLGATAPSGTINWYSASTGGSPIGTGATFTTPALTTTTTYFVDATSGGCTSGLRTAVVATINAIPTITGTTPGTVCGTGTAIIGATASAGIINWYTSSTGGTSLGTGNSFTTPAISSNTSYWVDATNNACTSARTEIIVTINKTPTVVTTLPAARCGAGTVTLGATASSGTINWYAALTGGTALGTGNSFTTPVLSSTTTYYVDASSGGCATAVRTAVVATINPLPVVSAPVSVAVGSTITLSPSAGGTWISNNPLIASVTPAGLVTGLLAGTATFTFTDAITRCSATTSTVTVTAIVSTPCIYLCNPDFEQFSGVTPPSGFSWIPQVSIPCWKTTASDGKIEIWHSGYGAIPAHSGNYFAELNATQVGTLYQDFAATAPQTVIASFWHRGRYLGVDVMKVSMVAPNGTITLLGTYSDNNTAWNFYSTASYPITVTGTYTLKFESVSSNNGTGPKDGGNFLDDITVTCPSSVCGIKYNDLNGDGQKQATEPVIPNWEITLTGSLTMTATTGADGSYCFTDLPAGTYTLEETQQSGWVQTAPANPGTHTVNLIEGQNVSGKDFGNRQLLNSSCIDFEDGTNGGWQVNNTLSSIITDGTNHYLQTTDQSGASSLFNQSRPLIGNWTDLLVSGCGSLCFDVNFLFAGNPFGGTNPPSTFTPYIAIAGNGFTAYFIITNPILAGSGWHSFCAPLAYLNLDGTLPANSDGHWVMNAGSNSDWNSLLSNVTSVHLPVDPSGFQGEQFGYDNICLKNTGDCITQCCDKVTVAPVLDATGKATCSAKIIATCEVRSIEVTVTNGTLNTANWNCATAIPTAYIGLAAYTFVPGSCIPELTTSVNATTSGIVTITYDITFSSGEKCRKVIEVYCGATCCDQVKVERVLDAAGKASCSAKITTNCEVKSIAVTVTNGKLSSVNWNCPTAIPTGYIGLSTYTFAPGSCNPEMITSVDAIASGTVTITYDITFSNGEKCQKKVDLDCSVPSCCDQVKVEPAFNVTGAAACCVKFTTTCAVRTIGVTVTNGTLSVGADWSCGDTPIPGGYIGQSAYIFIPPAGCAPILTTCVDAIKSGVVTITYDIVFANGEKCQKSVRLDCAVASECVTPPAGMVLWLPGDGNANDISGLNNHGTLAGTATYSTGKVANAFRVGNYMDKITVPDNSSLNFGIGNFSADAWINTTDNIHFISIADKSVSVGNNMIGYRLFIIQGKLYFQMGDGSAPLNQYILTVPLADGAWHFVGVTIDRSSTAGGKLYIDGSVALTFDPTTKPGSISNTIPLTVAGNNMANFTASDHYTFYLDEVELFNRVITEAEFASIYNAGSAGKCKLGSICGTKFNDLNGNGRRDKDEPGIPEWKIMIGGTADLTTYTDRDGNYCFYNLEPGEYKIGEEVRTGWQQIIPVTPGAYSINLPAGQNLTGLDFGNRLIPQTGSICGSKFNDLNGNGQRDEGEPGIGDWTILLGGGVTELKVTTDKNGNFCFDNLKPGIYKLGEENRVGWLQMKPTGGSYNITLIAGQMIVGQDFGNMLDSRPASICGIKFNDLNGNGSQDSNEPGLPNWMINLTGSATMTTVTDRKGNFCFTGLKPGTYTVSEVNQPLWHQTAPHPTGNYTVTLTAGQYLENLNFGNQHDQECVTPPIGLLGWWPGDDNANDITLNGDFGTLVNGATFAPGKVDKAFSLMGSTDYVNIPNRPQLNPASGDFTIDCWIQTSEAKGTFAILDKRGYDANQNISGYGLYVVDGHLQLRLSDSAGNGLAAALYNDNTRMIADGQWHFVAATVEQGANHAVTLFIDGVMGIPNTWGLPTLNYSNNADLRIGEAYFNTYSNNSSAGHYHNFPGLIDEVEFIYGARPEAELAGIYNAGSAGKCKPSVQLGSICGSKFNDLNGNGIRDARGDGEPGIPNWTIKLTGAATLTTTTDVNGNFCFNNLPAGQYTITEVNQAGWIQTAPLNPNTFTVTLKPGAHIEVLNFGNKVDPTFGCVSPPSGMVLWLSGDGHARDLSGLNNHGTLEAGASYVSGKVDQAFSFSNNYDVVTVPNSASINFGEGNFSIDAWVKTTDNINNVGIVMKNVFASAYTNTGSILYSWQIGYGLLIHQGKLSFTMGDNSSLPFINFDASATVGLITDGKWHFVAVTVDRKNSSGGKLYMDGNVVLTFDPTSRSGSVTYSNDLRIGYHLANKFINQIDEAELFNRVITGDEIASIYNAGSSGKCKLGSICGMKFNDLNGNGKKDEGEPGISDWLINLSGTGNLSVRTEKDGSFCFTNLNPGEYKISEEIRDGWIQTAPGSQGNFTVTLPAGRNLTGYNFGNNYQNTTSCVEPPSGMVAWWAFDETSGRTATDFAGYNNSGTLINGPLPVPAKVLKGLQFDGLDDYVEAPNQPELNFDTGDFSFDAWIKTSENAGMQMLVSKRSSTGYAVFLNSGNLGLTLSVPSIAAMSWTPSVFVADGNWHHIAVTVSRTNIQGIVFYLDGIATPYGDPTQYQGSLTNSATLMIGTQQLPNPSFNFKGVLDEIELFNRVITKAEIVSIFNAGSSGKCKLGSICGTKYNDLNGNGRRDDGEPGIPDWLIMLDGRARLTAITDKEGNYCFTNLVSGDYKIMEELRPDWQQKAPASGYYGVNLSSGQNIKGKDFGNMLNSQLGSICGVKYNDLNGNGKRDKDEPGIPDWTILIGGTADFKVSTDKNGEFCLNNLKPGVYKIGEQLREGWIQTAPSERYFTIELKEGQHVTNLEFGNMLDPKTGSICGMKFNDVNGNGIMDNGEQAIPDWTINLSGPTNLTIQTDKSGNYCFTRLPAGTYTIAEGSRAGWYQTTPKSGTYSFTLKPGESVIRMNFGNTNDPCYNEKKSWSSLGSGMNEEVYALTVLNGKLVAGGSFSNAGGSPANRIAKWDGSNWSALGSGINVGWVSSLAVKGSTLYAGGEFLSAGGMPSTYAIAKWDENGSTWSSLGTGTNSWVYALTVIDQQVYAKGIFTTAGGVSTKNIARWDGTSWFPLGSGINNSGFESSLTSNGSILYAGGYFNSAGGVSANSIAKWDETNSSWSPLGSGVNGGVRALVEMGGDLYAAGGFTMAGGVSANRIAKWNGSTWAPLGVGTNGAVFALAAIGSDLYVGGDFTIAGGIAVNGIAKWDGTNWSSLGTGMGGPPGNNSFVNALEVIGSDLYAGGYFNSAGGVSVHNIAKYSCSAPTSVAELNLQPLYQLDQNYPNPFNSTSTIGYSIPQTSIVNISVYDIYGKEIKVLVNEEKGSGHHEIVFDRRDFVSGIYFYTLKTAGFIQSKKMIIMK